MMIAVTTIHVIACIVLVLVVLLQAGKGADMGAVFGGASSTIFGSSGAGNFLTRLTTGAAVVFMVTSLMLTYGSTRGTTSTIMPESATAPGAAAPEAVPAEEPVAEAPLTGEPIPAPAPAGDAAPAPDAAAPADGGAPAGAPAEAPAAIPPPAAAPPAAVPAAP
jgi:preprotein translocase subunit SecG